jgi:hypothetical protein
MKNSVILATDKQMYRISYICNKSIPVMYFDNNIDVQVVCQYSLICMIK